MAGIKTPSLWLAGSLECFVYLGFFASKTFMPLYAIESGISVIWVGIFFSAQELIHLITRPLGGRLSDRFGYLIIIASGMLIAASAFGLIPMIHSPYTRLWSDNYIIPNSNGSLTIPICFGANIHMLTKRNIFRALSSK